MLFLLLGSCGTDALGIETCRSIEWARCDAALACGLVDDAESCKRYSRDHCLHGVAVEAPSPTQVNRCVAAIEKLGRCADDHGRKSSAEKCDDGLSSGGENVCELVLEPELAKPCEFLVPPEPEPEPEPDPKPKADAGSE